MTRLSTLSVGVDGPRIAFLHGLFGQGRNWAQIAKAVAGPDGTGARCLLVDLPDHGRSPWSASFSYAAYAAAVHETLTAAAPGESWTLVGHSVGGKVAMLVALTHPESIERLVVVDMAPRGYGNLDRFAGYIAEMRALPLRDIETRADAEARFAEPDSGVKAFLLQNLRRDGANWRWQVNLELIATDAARGAESRIAGWPAEAREGAPYDGPVVWLVGGESDYVGEADLPAMRALFPRVRKVSVNGAGHWVHTDRPAVVTETLRRLVRAG